MLAVDGVAPKAVRAMQSFISEGQWNDEQLLHQHWQEVETDLGADDGVLMVDGSDFPKQGVPTVGVKRQDCGELGKRATAKPACLWAMSVSRATPCWIVGCMCPPNGSPMTHMRNGASSVALPPDLTFKTKPELAQAMLAVVKSQALRCRWVVADEAFGGNPGFLDGVAGLGLWYFVEVPHHAGLGRASGHTSRRGVGAAVARSGSAWWRAPQRRGQCWRWLGRCPPGRGYARPSKKAARDQWWRILLPYGWSLCGTPCPVLMSGWCCVGTSRRGR